MNYIDENLVNDVCACLRKNVDFRILYDLGEIPEKLKVGKDLDILVRGDELDLCASELKKLKFRQVIHPNSADVFIYGAKRRLMYKREGMYVDVHRQLVVRSLDAGQWMPIDMELQKAAWSLEPTKSGNSVFLPPVIEFSYLVARCIFDKRGFGFAQRERLTALNNNLKKQTRNEYLSKIFFAFTPVLIEMIEMNSWDEIVSAHSQFGNY